MGKSGKKRKDGGKQQGPLIQIPLGVPWSSQVRMFFPRKAPLMWGFDDLFQEKVRKSCRPFAIS